MQCKKETTMQIGVIAESSMQSELQDKQIPAGVRIDFYNTIEEVHKDKDAYMYLLPETALQNDKESIAQLPALTFVNAVVTTLKHLPENCVRICSWPGFLLHESIEIVAAPTQKENAAKILDGLHFKHSFVPDEVGMIAPRVIATIINEAFYLLEKHPGEQKEIDDAIKAGTNSLHGPFEWCEKIGKSRVFDLLVRLQELDNRFTPASSLNKEN